MTYRILLKIILTSLLVGCNSVERQAWTVAESEPDNRVEISDFLDHYKRAGNNEKYQAACFLVANMPNKYSIGEGYPSRVYDLKVVKADSLIRSLDYSFALRDTSEYLSRYSFDDFCEYILPYRIASEPLSYYWKWDCRERYKQFANSDMVQTATALNKKLDLAIHSDNYSTPVKSYSSLIAMRYGKCDDRAILLAMICRSLGIPAAYEVIPKWGNHNNGHSFCTVILGDTAVIAFQENENSTVFHRKVAKIYRNTYAIQPTAESNTPPFIANRDLVDVTCRHAIGTRSATIVDASVMCVFSVDGWTPIAYDSKGRFSHLGTGMDATGKSCDEAEQMGNGIVYLPAIWSMDRIIPKGDPLIVSDGGIIPITADTSSMESITLTRKYPLQKRIVNYARNMVGGVLEGANMPDFSDAEILYTIKEQPYCRRQTVVVYAAKAYRYLRYRKPRGIFSIAGLCILDVHGQPIPFAPIGEVALMEAGEIIKAFDHDPLTYIEFNVGVDLWVGADLKKPHRIGAVELAPRNDDNCISPDDMYELFYWNGKWRSLGQETAIDYTLTFDRVPRHALLWLRDLTRGREERPFTYEKGQQVWW